MSPVLCRCGLKDNKVFQIRKTKAEGSVWVGQRHELQWTSVHTCLTSLHTHPYLLFAAPAISRLSRHVWRRRGQCNVSQVYWVLLAVSMKPVPCPFRSALPSHWKGADGELSDGMDEKNRVSLLTFMGKYFFRLIMRPLKSHHLGKCSDRLQGSRGWTADRCEGGWQTHIWCWAPVLLP